jgi:gamma-glutamyltranspeptidase
VLQRRADPQDALDAPRWSIGPAGGADVEVETREPDLLGNAFRAGGLSVSPFPPWDGRMGRSYIALVEQSGIAAAGDLRGEGQALVY